MLFALVAVFLILHDNTLQCTNTGTKTATINNYGNCFSYRYIIQLEQKLHIHYTIAAIVTDTIYNYSYSSIYDTHIQLQLQENTTLFT